MYADVRRLANSTRSLKPGYQTYTQTIINPQYRDPPIVLLIFRIGLRRFVTPPNMEYIFSQLAVIIKP